MVAGAGATEQRPKKCLLRARHVSDGRHGQADVSASWLAIEAPVRNTPHAWPMSASGRQKRFCDAIGLVQHSPDAQSSEVKHPPRRSAAEANILLLLLLFSDKKLI